MKQRGGGGISQVNKGHYEDFSHRGGKLSCRSLFTCARADLQLSCAGPPGGAALHLAVLKNPPQQDRSSSNFKGVKLVIPKQLVLESRRA